MSPAAVPLSSFAASASTIAPMLGVNSRVRNAASAVTTASSFDNGETVNLHSTVRGTWVPWGEPASRVWASNVAKVRTGVKAGHVMFELAERTGDEIARADPSGHLTWAGLAVKINAAAHAI